MIVGNNKSLGEQARMLLNIADLDHLNLVLSHYCRNLTDRKSSISSSLQVRLRQPGCKLIHYLYDNKLFRPFIAYKVQYKIDLQINVNMNFA